MKAEHTLEFKYVLRNKMIGEEGNLKREVTDRGRIAKWNENHLCKEDQIRRSIREN